MSEENPFAGRVPKTHSSVNRSKLGWIIAGILAVLLIAALLLWAIAVGKARGLESLRSKLDDANASLASALADNQKDKDQIATLQSQVADLEKEKQDAAQMAKGLEDEMRAGLESKDVTISKLQGKLTVNILDRVMFDSGEAVLKPEGESVMRKIAAILIQHPELKIHVIGHTDNVPIRGNARLRFPTNWELSTARATRIARLLLDLHAVSQNRLSAAGYAEFHPVAPNDTPEGRAENRRVDLVVLPRSSINLSAPITAAPRLPHSTGDWRKITDDN